MSAFLCSATHISRIVNAATLAPAMRDNRWLMPYLTASALPTVYVTNTPEEALFSDLLQTNLDSISARYPHAARIEDWNADGESAFRYDEKAKCETAVAAIKLLQSYRYQSCEHEGWETSLANRYTERLIAELITELPGWEVSPWRI